MYRKKQIRYGIGPGHFSFFAGPGLQNKNARSGHDATPETEKLSWMYMQLLDVHVIVACTCDIAFSGRKFFGRIRWTIEKPQADRSSVAGAHIMMIEPSTIGPVHDDPVLFSPKVWGQLSFLLFQCPVRSKNMPSPRIAAVKAELIIGERYSLHIASKFS
jgi:hypothetical protein